MVVVDSCVISASGLVYFIFDSRYLEDGLDCFVGNIPGILAFSIGSVGVFLCWNYLLFPIVGIRRSRQVLLRSYRA